MSILDTIEAIWDNLRKGPLSQVVIICDEADYAMGLDMKRHMFEESGVPVKLMSGENMEFDDGTILDLEPGKMALSFIHDGNWIVNPSIETHTMTFEKED